MPFDQAKADHVIKFFRNVLNVNLPPWSEKCLREVFGTVTEDGRRQYRTIYIEVPGRSGKSVLLGGIGLYLQLFGGEQHNQVHTCAATREQCGNIFLNSLDYVQKSQILKKKLKPLPATKKIQDRKDILSFYRCVSADGSKNDGFGGFVLVDELHRWHSASQLALWEVINKAGLSLKEPLKIIISTAGSPDESPLCWKLHNYAKEVASGKRIDPTFYPLIFGLESNDDWHDQANWIKVNPSLKENGGFLDLEALRQIYRQAIGDPAAERSFRRFHLNTWLSSNIEAVIDSEEWLACCKPLKNDLKDRPCYLGIDLSSCLDLTALVAVFPDYEDGSYDVMPFFWRPLEGLDKAGIKDKVPYEQWHREGFLNCSEGKLIAISDIFDKIKELAEQYDIREIVCDRYGIDELQTRLEQEGFTVIRHQQNMMGMTHPTKRFLEFVKDGKLRTGGHPILTWNAQCLDLESDSSGNVKPVKPKAFKTDKRIDGVVASIMALDRAYRNGYGNSDPYADGHSVLEVDL
jgi:phage terminase large subunit-like protein